ncbi:hypothetical protein A7L22_18775 [Acinetobacter baumannii]|nr:hypothetical protein A7L22_18775 [Acinetobacter baumannii]
MLPAAAPVDSGAEPVRVPLAEPREVAAEEEAAADPVEAGEEEAPVPAAGMVELLPTMGVTMVETGATGVAVGTTMMLVLVRVAVRVTAEVETPVVAAGTPGALPTEVAVGMMGATVEAGGA